MEKKQPEIKFRAGAISASVWENEVEKQDGTTGSYKTISLQRCYKDKAGDWKNCNSMRANDLPKAMVVLTKAYEHLVMKDTAEAA
ncbi:MAG: hypothetical protein KJ709_08570 [Nanoarchaeota archaeon]|nr:hypothetical protein [Nanoarchaeota archaeon]